MGIFSVAKQISITVGMYPEARALHRVLNPENRRLFLSHRSLLSRFVGPGDLAFDVGANIGSRTEILLSIGAHVIAFEPQPECAREILAHRNPRLTVVQKAVGEASGKARLYTQDATTHASFLPDWERGGKRTGTIEVELTTLDASIAQYGVPKFCKIDVEGAELSVLRGLSKPIPACSFEYHRDSARLSQAKQCLSRLAQLGEYSANLTGGDEAELLLPRWLPLNEFSYGLSDFGRFWGDIFVKLT